MRGITVSDILRTTGGRLLCGSEQTAVEHISLDSRRMEGADLFVPIIGEKTDGHRYLSGAFANGAAAAFTSEHDEVPPELAGALTAAGTTPALIRVENTVQALQTFGLFLRSRLSMPVVGITGSVGKTSTREMVCAALSGGLTVTATEGNSNGQLGVPVTLGRLDETAQIAVMEMGVSEPGEMVRIAAIAKPDMAVMTNIGVSHIENLGSREGIFREKLHIADGFGERNALIVNGDDDWLSTLRGKTKCRLITYGLGPDNDLSAEDPFTDGRMTRFVLADRSEGPVRRMPVELTVPGNHNVANALAAIAAAKEAGVPAEAAIEALRGYHGYKRRLQWIEGRELSVIDDSYNASPDSAKAAVRVLAQSVHPGRKVMIFADMLELGPDTVRYHTEVCDCAREMGIDELITIGPFTKKGAAASAWPGAVNFADNFEAKQALPSLLQKNDLVLVKGSNGMHLEEIVAFLREMTF